MSVQADFETVCQLFVQRFTAVQAARIMRSEGLRTGNRFFAFARDGELVCKLPAPRVASLQASSEGRPFRSGGRVMREWIRLVPADADAMEAYVMEAYRFVAESGGARSANRPSL